MRADWLSAYDYATPRAGRFLGDYARAADPFARIGEKTVSVQVTSVVRASDRSFQVKWIETGFDRGSLVGTSHWTAILTVLVKPPATAEVLRRNPLGLYVDAIDWSRELDVPAPVAAAQAGRPSTSPPNLPLGSPLDPTLSRVPPLPTQETQP